MLHHLTIDLLALAPWLTKLGNDERCIIGLLRSMDSDNPRVRRRMLGTYKQFSTFYIIAQLSLPASSARTIKRRIAHLTELGIIKRFRWLDRRTGKMTRYVKLTPRYWKAENRALDDPYGVAAKLEGRSHARANIGPACPHPSAKLALNHKTMIKESGDASSVASPPPLMAAGGAAPEASSESRAHVMSEEAFQVLAASLPWKMLKNLVKDAGNG